MKRTVTDTSEESKHQRMLGPPAPDPLPLEQKNAHPRDARVVFHDKINWRGTYYNHRYWIDGVTEGVKSVTVFCHFGYSEFDADAQIEKMKTGSMLNPRSEYYGMTEQEVRKQWSEAGPLGTYMHLQIELYENGLPYDGNGKEMQMFFHFKRDHPNLTIWRTEMNLFCKDLMVAGQADAIYRNENGEYEIYDWKRTKKIWPWGFCDCRWENGRKEHVTLDDGSRCSAFGSHELTRDKQDCNKTHYTIQLNLYRWLLKRFYGIDAVRLVLVVLHPNQKDGYIRMELPIWEDYVVALMLERAKELHPEKFQ